MWHCGETSLISNRRLFQIKFLATNSLPLVAAWIPVSSNRRAEVIFTVLNFNWWWSRWPLWSFVFSGNSVWCEPEVLVIDLLSCLLQLNSLVLTTSVYNMSSELCTITEPRPAALQTTTVGGSKPLHRFMKGQPKTVGVRAVVGTADKRRLSLCTADCCCCFRLLFWSWVQLSSSFPLSLWEAMTVTTCF